jgi:hypothetical protein
MNQPTKTRFLTVRVSTNEIRVIERLQARTGLSISAIVRIGLRVIASEGNCYAETSGLYALGEELFGRHGDRRRQSTDMKRVGRARRTGRYRPGRRALLPVPSATHIANKGVKTC